MEGVSVLLEVTYVPNATSHCEISSDLGDLWDENQYAYLTLPSYNELETITRLIKCHVKNTLPSSTVRVPARLLYLSVAGPTVPKCTITPVPASSIPSLNSVSVVVSYEQYKKLQHKKKLTYALMEGFFGSLQDTLLTKGQLSIDGTAFVKECEPSQGGFIDTTKTAIFFTRNPENIIPILDIPKATSFLSHDSSITIKLKCLPNAVSPQLITPASLNDEDESLYVFADFQILLRLGICSGSYATISSENLSILVKIFVLLQPHTLSKSVLYTSPRVICKFDGIERATICKYNGGQPTIPTAASVSVARVGSWDQTQKVYENIIFERLRTFFTNGKRMLQKGDLIPITFDSTLAKFYTGDSNEHIHLEPNDDHLVWFSIENIKVDNHTLANVPVYVDPLQTKLTSTNIINVENPKGCIRDIFYFYRLPIPIEYKRDDFEYVRKFYNLLQGALSCFKKEIFITTLAVLYSTIAGAGELDLIKSCGLELGFHFIEIDCITTSSANFDSVLKIIDSISSKLDNTLPYTIPAIVLFSHLDALLPKGSQFQDPTGLASVRTLEHAIINLMNKYANECKCVFVATVDDIDAISREVMSFAKFELEIPSPNEKQRLSLLNSYLSAYSLNRANKGSVKFCLDPKVSVLELAQQTAGLSPQALEATIDRAKYAALDREKDATQKVSYEIKMTDLSNAIMNTRDKLSKLIGAPQIPSVKWEDVGGMDSVQKEILDTIDLPLKHPELFASGVKKRSGVLFYGPPGTGKTLLAKAIATNFSLNFFSIKGPELLNMYIGESEANMRRVFQKARDAKPCVIFFDELDSVAPKRGNQGDSGGVMDRIVSQLLAELDGISQSGEGVFVIGATNRPDLLDESLLRPGRFDRLLYLGISDTHEKQLKIMKALTRKFKLSSNVDLKKIADNCPFNYTGADFYALCSDAILGAMGKITSQVDQKVHCYNKLNNTNISTRHWLECIATPMDLIVEVSQEDFLKAQTELIPSVSAEEIEHYLRVKANFENN